MVVSSWIQFVYLSAQKILDTSLNCHPGLAFNVATNPYWVYERLSRSLLEITGTCKFSSIFKWMLSSRKVLKELWFMTYTLLENSYYWEKILENDHYHHFLKTGILQYLNQGDFRVKTWNITRFRPCYISQIQWRIFTQQVGKVLL